MRLILVPELAAPSMRQLIRTLVQVGHDPNAEIASLLKHQMLYSFMPSHTKNRVDEILKQCGISQATTSMTRVSVPDSTTQAAKDSHLVPHARTTPSFALLLCFSLLRPFVLK
jgi:hypothetical protein